MRKILSRAIFKQRAPSRFGVHARFQRLGTRIPYETARNNVAEARSDRLISGTKFFLSFMTPPHLIGG
jgi:hypothetical protein